MSYLGYFWYGCFILCGILLLGLLFFGDAITLSTLGFSKYVIIFLLAFFCEYMDSSIGMGYGTTLTPILMILGFNPLEIVPIILISEMFTGISSGLLHHKEGNVDFSINKKPFKVMSILAFLSVFGTILAVFLALNIPKYYVKIYIGVMILGVGLFLKFGKSLLSKFSWVKISILGLVAAFNKGISGGGYGPLMTGGQILTGVDEKEAVGITSLTEGIVCITGIILYYIMGSLFLNWSLGIPLVFGAMCSVPLATKTVKILPKKLLQNSIGYATIFLGIITLLKIFI